MTVDPFDAEFEDAPEPEEESNEPESKKEPSEPDPGSPIPPDSPIPDPPMMASAPTPTSLLDLQGWYNAAHRLYNINSHLASFSNTQSEWDMDVDAISVNALSREERERHVQNNLCFICHKDGHMSKECPDRKHYKGGSSKGKYKGKYKKGK